MKRLLVSGALLSLAAAPAVADDIKVYGTAHLAGSYLDNGASGTGEYSAFNVSSNSSKIGIRGSHEIAPGLRGIAQAEGKVEFNQPDSGFSLSSYDTFLGLAGEWGTVRVGHVNTPTKNLRSRVDLFGNQLGDARNVIDGGFDNRFKNSIIYTSPSFAGVTADLHYSAETENDAAVDSNKQDAWSVSLTYRQGPVYAAVAHEQWNNSSLRSVSDDRNATRVAASYDIANVRVTGFAQFASYDAPTIEDSKSYGLGLRYALTPQIALKAQYYTLDSDADNSDADLIAVGADYQAAKNMRVYLNYAQVSNDSGTNQTPWNTASTLNKEGAYNETAKGVALGVIYNF